MEQKANLYANISQRAVSSYQKTLVDFKAWKGGEESGPSEAEQHALHDFFACLYTRLFEQPEFFGLPTGPDTSIAEDEPNSKDKKQEVKRLLEKPRGMIEAGLNFLMLAGADGKLEGADLVLEDCAGLVKRSKIHKKFLKGMENSGLLLHPRGDAVMLVNEQFAGMMPALKALAKACTAYDEERVGRFLFAGCDFRALHGATPQAVDLFRFFDGENYTRVLQLHTYFAARNYKTEVGIGGPFAWTIKYQGDRKIKGTPLFQVEYEERYARPLRMMIKCASTERIASLLPQQPQFLQDDFIQRANRCNGDKCGWCRNNKTLGPSVVAYQGDFLTLCWYSNPDVHGIDGDTVELIEQYEQMHAALAPE
jgi:hypothetical protein